MDPNSLRNYYDIKKLVSASTFRCATNYLSWHNRLAMTPMLEVWEGLIVALACDHHPIDDLQYSAVKSFLDSTRNEPPQTMLDCQMRAEQLSRHLAGS